MLPTSTNGNGNTNGNGHYKKKVARIDPFQDRLPPQNLDAERGVIGSILLDNSVFHEVVTILKPEDFFREPHQILFRVISELYDDNRPIDTLTLSEELRRRDSFEAVGGDELIESIVLSVPHAANANFYAVIVREKSVLRQLITGASEILQDSYTNLKTADEVLHAAERKIFQIAEEQATGETAALINVLEDAMDRIAARSVDGHGVNGVPSGLIDLDDITTGFQPEQLVILAARPSMGKTALALNIADYAAVAMGQAVLIVSLEMGKLELAERLLCSRSRIDGHKMRTGKVTTPELAKLGSVYNELQHAPIFIDDTSTRNMLQITANARRIKLKQANGEHPLGLILVDYIQLIEPESGDNRDSRQEQIAKISRRLKTLARELKVPVIALSQLNRAVESREDRRPRMADLRESGAIEQDADLVLLLHRPEYYDANDQPGIAELIVAKNRNGRTDSVKLTFLKNIMRFENLRVEDEPINAGTF